MQRQVTVSAEGRVSAKPDVARISSGVVSAADTAAGALAANNAAMQRLLDGLKAAGIAEGDIQTTSFNVSPRYVHAPDGSPPRINGYNVSNDLSVVVRRLSALGSLLDEFVKLGANQISGLSFEVAESERMKDEARRLAMQNARKRAELYASAAGASLGAVLTISEATTHETSRGPMLARVAAGSVPIAEGTQDISARVTVSYELG